MDLVLAERHAENFRRYVDALLQAGSPRPEDWEKARRTLESISPFFVFKEDPELIHRFRQGDESARAELGKRGRILHATSVFTSGYDREKWEEARKILMEAGEPGQVLLSVTLLQMLLNGLNQPMWVHLRYHLAASGPVALETAQGLADRLIQDMPSDTPIFKIEDLTQVLLVISGFGDAGLPYLRKLVTHEKPNVRRTTARALGEAREAGSVGLLADLLADPRDWTVRAAAAESLGRMVPERARAGAALVSRIGKEKDLLVLRMVVRAIGELGYPDGVPALMQVLEVPSRDLVDAAMLALVQATGVRLARKELWQEWYRTEHAGWKRRQEKPR